MADDLSKPATGNVLFNGNSVPHDAGVAEARRRVELNKRIDADDAFDAQQARRALQHKEQPADFAQGERVLSNYLAKLSPEARARIQTAPGRDGGLSIHDPQTLLTLTRTALGPFPRTAAGAQAEIAAAKDRMKNDPRSWFADDKAQLRYRMLLRATEAK